MPSKYRLAVLLASWCQLRFGELTELRRRDIDTAVGVVRVSRAVVLVHHTKQGPGQFVVKTPKSEAGVRDVHIPPHLLPLVRKHLMEHIAPGTDGLLFPSRNDPSRHLRQSSLMKCFYPARKAGGRPDLRWHDLRHTGAVLVAQSGATLPELMQRMGHSTLKAAQVYMHVAQDRDAVLAERLSAIAEANSPAL